VLFRSFAFIEDEETEPVRPQKAKPVAKPSAEEEEDEDVEYEEEVVEEDE
jgi:hypothetical protein